MTVTFTDGTKATIFSGDMIMGGVRNLIETYTNGGALFANITPNNHMLTYHDRREKLAGVYITEKVDRKTGWQFVCLEEEWTRGYLQEIQDFMECVATGRQPLADLDLACETMRIQYAAIGRRRKAGASRYDAIEGWTPPARRLSLRTINNDDRSDDDKRHRLPARHVLYRQR